MRTASKNPNGISSQSPGLRGTSYPGKTSATSTTPTGLRLPFDLGWARQRSSSIAFRLLAATPLGLCQGASMTQGSSCLATLGLAAESRWDSSDRPTTGQGRIGATTAKRLSSFGDTSAARVGASLNEDGLKKSQRDFVPKPSNGVYLARFFSICFVVSAFSVGGVWARALSLLFICTTNRRMTAVRATLPGLPLVIRPV